MSLGRQAAQGAIWNYAAFLVSKGLLFVATLVLARLLTPAEFGLVGMALLVITLLDILRDFGMGSALIYRQRDGKAAANMAFFLSSGIGVILFTVNLLLAPVAATFFKTSGPDETASLTLLLQVLGLSLLFSSLGSAYDALLQKEIDYRRRMVPEVGRTLVKGVLSVVLALMGWGAWSLVIGQVVGEFCATVLLWVVVPWRPSLKFERSLFRPMMGYGLQVMMAGGLGTLLGDVDYLIIGRLLGETALGLYTLAFRIPELLIRNLAQAVSTVAFPVAARLQADIAAMRDAYLTMQRYMLVILAPLGFGLYAVTPAVIHFLFPSRWDAVIPVMQILSIYMLLGGINHWPGVVYKAVGRPDMLNRLSLVKLVMLVPVLWWGATNYGIEGVAWGQLIVRVAGIIIDMWVVSGFVGVSVWANLRVIWPPMVASAIMAAAVQVLLVFGRDGSSILSLVLATLSGSAIYVSLIWLLDGATVNGLVSLARSMLRRKSAVPTG
ncbi:MAG: lipopolysaccharide biosynthesis protein [Chloroflexota bacterium]